MTDFNIAPDEAEVSALIQFYKKDLKQALKSARTGAPIKLPATNLGRAQLLNLLLYQPEYILIWGGSIAFSQLDVYRPYLSRTKRRIAIVADSLKGRDIADLGLGNVPVYLKELDFDPNKYLSSVKGTNGLLYVSHKPENYRYISRNKNLIHVYSGHGYSEKHTAEFRMATAYDYILRADTTSTYRFYGADIPLEPSRFLLTGGSPVEGVDVQSSPATFSNVLYAPTWEGHGDEVSFTSVDEVTSALISFAAGGGHLGFRPHPGLGGRLSELKKSAKKIEAVRQSTFQSKAEAFNWSDVIIADVSGIVPEYLFSAKPIVIPVSRESWKFGYVHKTDLPTYCYVWITDEETLDSFLRRIAHDPLREARLQKRFERFLGSSSVDELCAHFDRALDFIEQARYQRRVRSMDILAREIANAGLFSKNPKDQTLRKLVADVRAGKRVLGF